MFWLRLLGVSGVPGSSDRCHKLAFALQDGRGYYKRLQSPVARVSLNVEAPFHGLLSHGFCGQIVWTLGSIPYKVNRVTAHWPFRLGQNLQHLAGTDFLVVGEFVGQLSVERLRHVVVGVARHWS